MITQPQLPQVLTFSLSPDCHFEMLLVEGGDFMMGDDKSDYASEKPAHRVLVKDFYLGKYAVTQQLWQAVMGENPSRFGGPLRPVEQISWEDAKQFLKKLNDNSSLKDWLKELGFRGIFRLPSESEWEYAARGGRYSQGYEFSGSDQLEQVGWFDGNSGNQTHEVGMKMANELGLYDMSGNVWEWCEDDWHDSYEKAPEDGSAWIDNPRGDGRVVRGGSYFLNAVDCRSAYRGWDRPGNRLNSLGFRLALSLQSVG